MLVEIKASRIREAAAKLPPLDPKQPESAIDAGIRRSAANHPDSNETLNAPSEMATRIDELLAPPKSAATPPAATKPAPVSAETKAGETGDKATK